MKTQRVWSFHYYIIRVHSVTDVKNKIRHLIRKYEDLMLLQLTVLHEQSSCVSTGRDGFQKGLHHAHVSISKILVSLHLACPRQCLISSLKITLTIS